MSIEQLAKQVSGTKGTDVFDETGGISKELVREYYEINERKKADEKWLKANKPAIEKALALLERDKVDVGGLRVSVVVPDTSHFDLDKVLAYLIAEGHVDKATRLVVDEDKLAELIESGVIDVEDLKDEAWVESKGSPRLTINKVKLND